MYTVYVLQKCRTAYKIICWWEHLNLYEQRLQIITFPSICILYVILNNQCRLEKYTFIQGFNSNKQ